MIPAELRIFVCTQPVDVRLGFDRPSATVHERLGEDPLSALTESMVREIVNK
jgi:hypothetical protein